ncbi:MAG: ATP-binding protein [Bacteroidota bacterium]
MTRKGMVPHKLVFVSLVYWVLLTYMVAALFWWFIALEKQNQTISAIRISEIKKDDPAYFSRNLQIEEARKRKTAQYIGEGSTFLALILLGAVFVYRATRRQIKLAQQQQNFMMAVTHELKTPIAIVQLNLETLQKRKLDEDKQQKLISNTLQEANRLNTLCNNILLASQLDAGDYRPSKEEINFTDLVEGCVDDFKNRFPQRTITEEIQERVYLNGEPLLLQMLVNNLVDNARKYSPKEMPIVVSLTEARQLVTLTITDMGQGIPEAEKKRIFDKFYRSGDESTRKATGTGLGLYLCRKIAASHKANISVTDHLPSGSSFAVTFQLS